MKKFSIYYAAILLLFCNCTKSPEASEFRPLTRYDDLNYFTFFSIRKGEHFSNGNILKPIETQELKFSVKFDSSAIYTCASPSNQNDINKLYGFSDNDADHHKFSARFGWRWSNNALRLFAYVYNHSNVIDRELGEIAIGKEVNCSIKIDKGLYFFTMGNKIVHLPRASATNGAKGYLLYPYFGGDELAPHDINIWIKNL